MTIIYISEGFYPLWVDWIVKKGVPYQKGARWLDGRAWGKISNVIWKLKMY